MPSEEKKERGFFNAGSLWGKQVPVEVFAKLMSEDRSGEREKVTMGITLLVDEKFTHP